MRQDIDHRMRWPTLWLFWGLTWGWMTNVTPAWGAVQPDVQVSGASAFLNLPGQRWLKQMLRNRGFSICHGEPTPCGPKTLQVQLSSSGHIQIRNDTAQRLFRVPPHYKEAQIKARAVVTFVSLFVEMTSSQLPIPALQLPPFVAPKPSPTKGAPAKGAPAKEATHRTRRRSRPKRNPRRARLTAKAVASWARKRQSGATSARRSRLTAKAVAPPTPMLNPSKITLSARRPTAPPTPKVTPSKKPHKKAPKTTRSLASVGLQGTLTPSKATATRTGWLGLGFDGMIGLQDISGIPFGGGLSLSGGGRLWALRLAIHAQPLLGLPAAAHGLLGRSDLLVGLAPLRGQFELWIEAGPSIELLWVRANNLESWQYRFGGLLGLRLAWSVHPRIKLYARPAALLFSQAYQFEQRGTPLLTASIWRIELALGIELRLW